MQTITHWLSNLVTDTSNNLQWLISEMDVTQWGIVAVIFVATGFMALKTRF